MKRKFASIIGIGAIGAGVAFNVGLNLSDNSLSDLALANVEALARSEDGGSGRLTCVNTISNSGPGNSTHYTYCGSCTAVLAKSWSDVSSCTP